MTCAQTPSTLDCLIVGAGPAGLTAAIYLARFRLAIGVVDAGTSRAALIPRTRNLPGYPGGISGKDLLGRMREHAGEFGISVQPGVVEKLARHDGFFIAHVAEETLRARSVLLATGVINNPPKIEPDVHDLAVESGLLRYCPICDGYEVTDRRIAVIGTHTHGYSEAMFLRMYSRDITLIAPEGNHTLSNVERARLSGAGIVLCEGPCDRLSVKDNAIHVPVPQGALAFDVVYPALGSLIRSELAVMLGAKATEDGCLEVDAHQRTSIAGLYAAGDVAKGLDQISHAMGEASVAATTIRNDLAEHRPILR